MSARPPTGRPFIGVHFECCGVYVRVYKDPRADVYRARCPRCLRPLVVPVAPGGTDARIFRAR